MQITAQHFYILFIRIRKKLSDLSEFDCGKIVSTKQLGLIIAITADLPVFSRTTGVAKSSHRVCGCRVQGCPFYQQLQKTPTMILNSFIIGCLGRHPKHLQSHLCQLLAKNKSEERLTKTGQQEKKNRSFISRIVEIFVFYWSTPFPLIPISHS